MNRLAIKISPIPAIPDYLLQEEGSKYFNIKLDVVGQSVLDRLFDINWDIVPLLEWILSNREALTEQDYPFAVNGASCIAEALDETYEKLDVDDDELVDRLYEYRAAHCLRFGLQGTDVKAVYLGKFLGLHQVSYMSERGYVSYNVDILYFVDAAEKLYDSVRVDE